MKGVPATWMHAPDKFDAAANGDEKGQVVLATVVATSANGGNSEQVPILVSGNYGKGRFVLSRMGHGAAALSCVGFITTFQRATEWAATNRVTQKTPADFPSLNSVITRVDIAEMDHSSPHGTAAGLFDGLAEEALTAMRRRADELNIGGVAVVAYFHDEIIQSWDSKMAVVGRHKDLPSQDDKGRNLLAIAYSKAAEMADTLANSGNHLREPMTGEFGWKGGIIVRGKTGYLIAAFSGGKSEEDFLVSESGIAKLQSDL
jgi:hypothetical protein